MNYVTGEIIELGDKVGLRADRGGVVISLIDTREFISVGEYGETYTEPPWEFLKKGVMIHFPMYGLIHYEAMEEDDDLEFISRGSVPVGRSISRASAPDLRGKGTSGDVEMTTDIRVGDRVRLLRLPDWALHDIPEDEQKEMLSFIGQSTVVTEVDRYGYFWIGFGSTTEDGDCARYSGHSFCVSREFIEPTDI